jgi:hypothetical protein
MNSRYIDWIWNVRGNLALAPGQTSADAFDRLDPLFRASGTSRERTNEILTFRKKDQAAQDKMSVFDGGVLQIEQGAAGSVLHYSLTSRALLFCFLAPLLFLAIGQLTLVVGKFQNASPETKHKAVVKKPDVPMNPIDKALGAPAPDKPKKDGDKAEGRNKKPSATTAYVFAAIFATLYVAGRILEDRLIKRLFRKKLLGA